ncbi:MAG: hypothetical protein OEW37_08930, partial [Rhodospirillaceae bacterium]|nr:hypothetical protein [Rhodospirillaceae bacterium]
SLLNIITVIGNATKKTYAQALLDRLREMNLVTLKNGYYSATSELILLAEKAEEGTTETITTIPASDRVVPLNHNGDPYKEAVVALDRALEEFNKDHPHDNLSGIENNVLFNVVAAGRGLLNGAEVGLKVANDYIVNPLRQIIERYDQAVVSGLVGAHGKEIISAAQLALDAVLKLLGLG